MHFSSKNKHSMEHPECTWDNANRVSRKKPSSSHHRLPSDRAKKFAYLWQWGDTSMIGRAPGVIFCHLHIVTETYAAAGLQLMAGRCSLGVTAS